MNIVLLKTPLLEQELLHLKEEFPQFTFLNTEDFDKKHFNTLKAHYWDYVEVVYGEEFSTDELKRAHQMRYLHCPSAHLEKICVQEILAKENILLSKTSESNARQIAEFSLAAISSFAKNLFATFEEAKKSKIWLLEKRLLLQVGLGTVGTAISELAQNFGLKVWGISQQRSFHPFCHKSFSPKELHALLPVADIVSLCLPKDQSYNNFFKKQQIELMKEDSILLILSPAAVVDIDALIPHIEKFRAVIIDSKKEQILSKFNSPPQNVLLSPSLAKEPVCEKRHCFRIFQQNLRHYVYNHFSEMKQVLGKTIFWENSKNPV